MALSTCFGELYCLKCNDFVYDRRVEKSRSECQNARRKGLGMSLQQRWNPGRTETRLLRQGQLQLLKMVNESSGGGGGAINNSGGAQSALGLRGLVNLGNTCFMNSIIQTLMHIPMLRDYFLSDQHHCKFRSSEALLRGQQNSECLMCELSHIFQEFYSGDGHSPYVPHRLLHLVWTHAKHLSGYEQHDAHEFLISALNILHRHSESISMKQNPHECKCIIDRLFTGQMQSDLTCTKCGRISTKLDPYWDISLELLNGKANQRQQLQHSIGSHHIKGEGEQELVRQTAAQMAAMLAATTAMEPGGERSLEECLQNFVRAENLGTKIKCDNCGTYEVSTKQLTLRKLPIVACFHLKRFEHVNASNKRQKIKNPVRFPEFIDLTPYTTPHRNSAAAKLDGPRNGSSSSNFSSRRRLSTLSNQYSLFAVVNHTGSTESGHYTCFVRHQHDNWFNCNDQKIKKERLEDVLASEGYLLFYCKSYIDYD